MTPVARSHNFTMMSSDISATPRPRPPAKARRTSSAQYKASPPPPYSTFTFPSVPSDGDLSEGASTMPNSPVSPTTQLTRSTPVDNVFNDVNSAVPNERSIDELSDLLVKADGMIRHRERGMCASLASWKFS